MLKKLAHETLAERAAQSLIDFIATNNLQPGKLLPAESRLAIDLGVSRPVIREALKSLEGRGIVQIINGKGAVIKPRWPRL